VFDLIYLDPPYTFRSTYGTWYHLLNTIALGDRPEISGEFNIRQDSYKSSYASQRRARDAFSSLFGACASRCRHLCMSYAEGSEGVLVGVPELRELLREVGFKKVAGGR